MWLPVWAVVPQVLETGHHVGVKSRAAARDRDRLLPLVSTALEPNAATSASSTHRRYSAGSGP